MIRLDLIAGPNGAGKSTLVRYVLQPELPGSVFVNADEIAKNRWPEAPETHAYEGAAIAASTRELLITQRRPFIAETVFSHPSKLDLIREAQKAGYIVFLHVVLVDPDTSVARVKYRVQAGGHHVSEEKIRERHARLGSLLASAIKLADEAFLYDNSDIAGPRLIAMFSGGELIGAPKWPDWAPSEFALTWPNSS